jgi:hypothetical protein
VMSGPVTTMAMRPVNDVSGVGTDIRSATAAAAATCCSVVWACATSLAEGASAAPVRPAEAPALPVVCWFGCGEGRGSGTTGAAFAALAGLGVRRTPWPARDVGGPSSRKAALDTGLDGAEPASSEAGSIGTSTAVRQASGFRPAHDGCRVDGWLLQPARADASAQMTSVLNRSSLKRLSGARNSCGFKHVALERRSWVQNLKRALSVGSAPPDEPAWRMQRAATT